MEAESEKLYSLSGKISSGESFTASQDLGGSTLAAKLLCVRSTLSQSASLRTSYYERLAIYRKDIIIPFGFLSMLIQAFIFAWVYQRAYAHRNGGLLSRGLSYAAFGTVLSWSLTTLAVAAKNVMTSVPDYLVIETAFTVVQWIMVGPLTALAFARPPREAAAIA